MTGWSAAGVIAVETLTLKTGVVAPLALLKLVRLSVSLTPAWKPGWPASGLSVNAVRSGAAGAVGAVRSIWTVRPALNGPRLPALSTIRDVY